MVSLAKGGNVSLSKEAPGMTKAHVGLGWDPRNTDGAAFDLDASVFMLGADEKVRSQSDFVFYGKLKSDDGSILHTGDNLTGDGDGDDEALKIDLARVPADVNKLVFVVTIHLAAERNQNFGQVGGAFIRIVDEASGREVVRYDLSEDYSTQTALLFGELYRHAGDWKFRALGEGYAGGLMAVCHRFGINATP